MLTMEYRQDIAKYKWGIISDVRALPPHGQLFEDDILQARNLLNERGCLFEELKVIDSTNNQR